MLVLPDLGDSSLRYDGKVFLDTPPKRTSCDESNNLPAPQAVARRARFDAPPGASSHYMP
jgi:hypothetical protein